MKLFYFVCCLFAVSFLQAQNFSNKGKEFWVGYGHNQLFSPSNTQEMVIYLSTTDQPANVAVSVNGTTWVRNYSIPAHSAVPTDLMPKTGADDCRITAEGLSSKAIHIVSDVPIVAYAHTYGQYSSGGTMLLPVETFSYTFYSVNPEQSASDSYSWFYVVASENNTTVRITPSRPSAGGQLQAVPFTVNLNKGQVYNVMGKINGSNSYDMSGSKIQSLPGADGICHPVGVFSGSSRTFICTGELLGSGSDFVMQQVYPINAWGTQYFTALTSRSTSPSLLNPNKFRVYIREPNTLVRKNGVLLTGLVNNFYYDYVATTNDVITATKPILVAQCIPSATGCGTLGLGDPEMFLLSPVDQAINDVVFYNTNKQSIQVNYLTMIIPQNGVSSLKIDGSNAFDYTYPHPNAPGYTVVVKQLPLTPMQHTATSDSNFTAITYGLGDYETYGYNAGTYLHNLESTIQVHNTYGTGLTAYTCPGTPFRPVFKTTYRPSSILWHLSAVSGLTPNADVLQDNYPIPTDSVTEYQRKFYLYELPGNYTFNALGTYTIPVTLTDLLIENCSYSTAVNIPVKVIAGPDADFTALLSQCENSPITFNGVSAAAIAYNKWLWTFGDGTIDSVQQVIKTYPAAGSYNVNLTVVRADGCIASKQKQVTIKPRSFSTINQSICEGQSYAGHTTTGVYKDTLTAANGCDSIRTLNLTVNLKAYSTINQSICDGQSYEGYTTTGVYVNTFTAANGCDSIRTLNLTVKPKAYSTINQSICDGQSYEGYSTTGVYVNTFTAANGCDSIRTLNLTVKPKAYSTINQSICDGQSYEGYTTTGVYVNTFTAANGCDSVRTLNLTVKPKAYSTINQSICDGQSYEGYTTTGVYVNTFMAANGCDSIRTLNLTVKPKAYSTINQSICDGQSYEGYTSTGVYVNTFTAANGCDSVRTLNLTVKPKAYSTINQSICDGQSYEGYTTTGVYVNTFTAANGCDSIRTLNLTVKPKAYSTINQSICDGQSYEGYTTTGVYVNTFTAANGCDSIRTLNLTVKPKAYSTINQSICDGQSYEGYTTTGVYVNTFTAANGCDSIRTLNLTVKPKSYSTINQSICDGQSYEGYTTTGVYVNTFTAANGCDSIRTLNLTVKPKAYSTINQSICDGQSYEGYTTTGVYVNTFPAANGCDSVRTLNLTVKPKAYSTINQSICDGQSYDGYTTTGVYVNTFIAANGCDSVRTLNLTVKPKAYSTINQSICDGQSYEGYTTTGVYVNTFTAANGCDSIRTLNLTVKPRITTTISQSVCQGQSYLGHTVTGIYRDTFPAVNGCDSIRILNLAVLGKLQTRVDKTICQGQSYAGYATAGTYTDTFTASTGCDSTRTLHLAVLSNPKPDLGPDSYLCRGDSLKLTPGKFTSYLWQDASTLDHFIVRQAGLYAVTVTNGCGIQSDTIQVTAKECFAYFPNAFTPDRNGINDVFKILYTGQLQDYQLIIYNRYGAKVFETKDYNKGWDGTYGGQTADQGSYVWYCSFKKSGRETKLNGYVILLR